MSTKTDSNFSRENAFTLLKEHMHSDKLIAHSIASEVIMRALADKFGEDPEFWGIAGLLHDIDFEMTQDDPARHGEEAALILSEKNIDPAIIDVIRKHNAEGLGLTRSTRFEHALTCAESITGMIVATALVYPDKKISSVKVKSVTKRMKTSHFARAVSRERIMECEKIGLSLNDFVDLSLRAMSGIADDLGL